jgi:hypothetical protein
VLDPAGRILLFSAADRRGRVWFTPGGGAVGDLVDSLVSDGVPAAPARLAWG